MFPVSDNSAPLPGGLEAITASPGGWCNYTSAEESPETVNSILDRMVEKGWATEFGSHDALCQHLGTQEVPLNKIGLISMAKADGTFKHRIIWDMRRSGVNAFTNQGQRIVLPRLRDAVMDGLDLLRECRSGESVQLAVIDIQDAFHCIPVRPDEQRFQATLFQGRYHVFRVVIFGSGSAPTIWGRVAAWIGRSTQALLPPAFARLQVFVDDPDRKSTRLNSSHSQQSRMPSSA